MKGLLVIALLNLTAPNCRPANLPTFTDEKVSGLQRETGSVVGVKVHLWQIYKVYAAPLNVHVAEVRSRVNTMLLTGSSLISMSAQQMA
jgi:hypothetical protein